MQDHPGAPGTARQEHTRTIVSTNDGGVATLPRAPGADVPPATTAEAPGQYRLRAALLAPGHDRPCAALRAAWHGRPSAATRAPGADVPPATTAEAPGQYRLRAALLAPGHDRPCAALHAAWHGRPSAATRAPGADVPPATTAGAPGQYRLRAALLAPGHDRPCAALHAAWHGRPSAATRAPGADVPPAIPAEAPGQYCLRAVAIATVALPAGLHRLRQVILPRTPATPNILTHPHFHQDTAHTHTVYRRATRYAQSRPHPPIPAKASIHPSPHGGEGPGVRPTNPSPCTAGGPQGGQIMSPASSLLRKLQSSPRPVSDHRVDSPSLAGKGPGVRFRPLPTTHQVHPAIQVPPRPRSCSTAGTGFLRQHPSRAPPTTACRKPTPARPSPLSTWWRGPGVRPEGKPRAPVIPAHAGISPSPRGRGPG